MTINNRAVVYHVIIFLVQWGLMITGFGILSRIIGPIHPFESMLPAGRYIDAAMKALIALFFSVSWLFIWDKQVRMYFYRGAK
jgi:hypothetical protein